MKTYRIVEGTDGHGRKVWFVQRHSWLFGWRIPLQYDFNGEAEPMGYFKSVASARRWINENNPLPVKIDQSKVVFQTNS